MNRKLGHLFVFICLHIELDDWTILKKTLEEMWMEIIILLPEGKTFLKRKKVNKTIELPLKSV